MRTIHIGVLHHKHGSDVFAGWTEGEVYAKVRKYAEEWWADYAEEGQELPVDPLEAVTAYFELAGDYEYLDMLSDEVSDPTEADGDGEGRRA